MKFIFPLLMICASTTVTLAGPPVVVENALFAIVGDGVQDGAITGAQVTVGTLHGRSRSMNYGRIGPDDPRPVTDDTFFCVASCSKPVLAALVFTLVDQQEISLDQTVGRVVPKLQSPSTVNGIATRSPTLGELLAHRGGIYSQMNHPTAAQMRAIRDFGITLDQSVDLISDQPLSHRPGTKYAYSGAGYVLVGEMAESASGQDLESLLQRNLCRPLGMDSTTFFPHTRPIAEIAVGGKSKLTPPHVLKERLRLTLPGGGLYSTAKDYERFARMILRQGRGERQQILSPSSCRRLVSSPFPSQGYGYGWRLIKKNGLVVGVMHQGSLPPYQATIGIDFADQRYKIAFWTLANPADVETTVRIQSSIADQVD